MSEPLAPHDSPTGVERRRHARVALDHPLTISLEDGYHEGRLRDVSEAGVCFFLDRQVPEMSVLRMQFDVPWNGRTATIKGSGVVVRCRPVSPHLDHYEIAVFLNDLTEEDRRRLRAFVASRE